MNLILLTKREKQCLYWAGQDKGLQETAEELKLSPETIKKYRKIVLQKLNRRTIAGALMLALEMKILDP